MPRFVTSWMLSIIAISCNNKNETPAPFKEFEFYYNNTWTSAFSMKFTQTDTVYLRQYFVSNRNNDGDSSVKSNTSYFAIFNPNQRFEFNNIIQNLNFSSYDSSYIDSGLADGTMIKFFSTVDSLTKPIVIYGDEAPPELLQLGMRIAEMKKNMRLVPIDTIMTFFHRELPEPPIDIEKFVPPSI